MSFKFLITLLVFFVTTLIVIICGAVINRLTEGDLRKQIDARLNWQVQAVSSENSLSTILKLRRFVQRTDMSNASVDDLFDVQIPTRIYLNNELFLYTDGFPEILTTSNNGYSNVAVAGKEWRVLTKTLQIPVSPRVAKYDQIAIQVAVSRDFISTTMQDFRQTFISVGVIAILLSALITWILCGVLLKPLKRLQSYAENINDSSDLSIRIPEENLYSLSEVKVLSQSLNSMISRLDFSSTQTEKALDTSRGFASNLAHELRTPLTSMKMNLELLERYSDMPADERRKIIKDVVNQQDRLFGTLESLRLLARGDLSERTVFEEVDLALLFKELSSRQISNQGGGHINLNIPDPPPLINAWREGLSVMFNNLIENAYVHSDLVVEKLEIDVTVTMEDDWIYLSVDDNGVGVEKHERRMVLERFQRGSNNHSQGSGLGLSLVTQQVEIHSGTVEIMESPKGGARVRVALPVIEGTDSN
ncbi:MAG: HAMP domain-containing sensor histidine kinase [Chloroflexota bacterium]|nr:HAMP domain-containing sensor histidine kinase [Chloroflexota bacterium]